METNPKILWGLLIFYLTECIAEFTVKDCRELGFIKMDLLCSTCDKLDDFGLEVLKPHCLECCMDGGGVGSDRSRSEKRYPKAILEVCTCKFRAYPQIEAFIKSGRPAKFPNLQIKYVRGLDPSVKLLDGKGKVQETLSITKWNTDTVEEFFDTHLQKVGGNKMAYSIVEEEDDDDSDDDDDFLKTNAI